MTLDDQINLEDKLFNEISKLNQGAVTNVSDHWIMINLKGNKVYDLLSKSCPYNFNNYKKSTIHEVFDKVCELANDRGVRVTGSELVGLIPLDAMLMAGTFFLS